MSAPVHTSTAPARTASAMHTTAGEWVAAPWLASGSVWLPGSVSRPDSPCTSGQAMAGLNSGLGAPGTTGTLAAPQAWRTRSALAVVLGRDWLPWMVEMPSSRRCSGLWQARTIARASSCPGSQSSHTSCGIRGARRGAGLTRHRRFVVQSSRFSAHYTQREAPKAV